MPSVLAQLLALVAVATPFVLNNKPLLAQIADDGSSLGNQGSTSPNTQAATPLPNILYDVVYYRTGDGAETVISIKNTTASSCQVQVQWLAGFIKARPQGLSGPINLEPQATQEFTTANAGEVVPPFVLNVFRNTKTNLEGSARIRSNCPASSRFGVNAVLVSGIGATSGLKYTPISVSRPTGRVGD